MVPEQRVEEYVEWSSGDPECAFCFCRMEDWYDGLGPNVESAVFEVVCGNCEETNMVEMEPVPYFTTTVRTNRTDQWTVAHRGSGGK